LIVPTFFFSPNFLAGHMELRLCFRTS
jgi:hypothetical protein